MKILEILPFADWLALAFFIASWSGYAMFAHRRGQTRASILATTNIYRLRWMRQAIHRDPRMLDGIITQSLSETPSFFCSTTIIIIGGLIALLGTTDKAAELVRDFPFAQPTPILVFEFKILVLIAIFVYAFFRFSWSMRQYTFVAYYFSFAAMGWFFSPPALVLATLLIIFILFGREFRSEVLAVMRD